MKALAHDVDTQSTFKITDNSISIDSGATDQ